MTEIELKAHVYNRDELERRLNEFARYEDSVIRDDVYYKSDDVTKPSLRIRKETRDKGITYLITYKRKELKTDGNGVSIEVNNEMECSVSDPQVLEAFLLDARYHVHLSKHKEVKDWIYHVNSKTSATIELCAVPPLGDFIEIEILSDRDDQDTINNCRSILLNILSQAGIPEKDIEDRYYSDLLKSKI